MLLDGVDARPRKSTDVVDVTYRANDPYVAQQVVNAIVDSYKEVNANIAQQQSRRRREFIQEQLKQTDSLFADATTALSSFRSQVQVYGSDARVAAEQTGLMTLDVTREAARGGQERRSSRCWTPAERLQGNAQRKTRRAPRIARRRRKSRRERRSSNSYLELRHEAGLAHERRRMVVGEEQSGRDEARHAHRDDAGRASFRGAQQHRRSRRAARVARRPALAKLRASCKSFPACRPSRRGCSSAWRRLAKMADQLREEFQRRASRKPSKSARSRSSIYAVQPDTPIGRGALFRILTGLIIGLMLGGGAAVLVERLNTTIRRRDDVELMLHVPGLAVHSADRDTAQLGRIGAWL